MGLFSSSKTKANISWTILDSIGQLDDIIKNSYSKPQVIFKHSTSCSISRMAKSRMEDGLEGLSQMADVYYLDLLNYRSLSNEIAKRFEVEHESPQVLIIKDGKSVYDASHNMVSIQDLKNNLS